VSIQEKQPLFNINVAEAEVLMTPAELKAKVPLTDKSYETVTTARETLKKILDRQDPRLFVVIGPCSIHDPKAAREYAYRLRELAEEISESIYLVMRVYFEKPRTTIGWKGFINDPRMDDSFHIEEGLMLARELLRDFAELGLPTGTEALDPITPQYITDLISWAAIGARTTESQTHREMASGLSMPVGFKNGTDGSIQIAIDGLRSASSPHNFLGINQQGQVCIIRTTGNPYGHVVLRGGGGRPNYDSVSISLCEQVLAQAGLPVNVVVDCSHANSFKNHALQPLVLKNVVSQIRDGNLSVIGLMMESNLHEGSQSLPKDLSSLKYGVSVTDACMGWETTESVLRYAHEQLKDYLWTERGKH
jgi:3-deoxy-7-phosphoheptulonate synthase